MNNLSKEEVQAMIEEAAKQGVHETLESLGFDMEKPINIQRNMIYLDNQRKASEQITTWTRRAVWGAILTGILSVLAMGFVAGVKQVFGIN